MINVNRPIVCGEWMNHSSPGRGSSLGPGECLQGHGEGSRCPGRYFSGSWGSWVAPNVFQGRCWHFGGGSGCSWEVMNTVPGVLVELWQCETSLEKVCRGIETLPGFLGKSYVCVFSLFWKCLLLLINLKNKSWSNFFANRLFSSTSWSIQDITDKLCPSVFIFPECLSGWWAWSGVVPLCPIRSL